MKRIDWICLTIRITQVMAIAVVCYIMVEVY